MSSPVRRVFLLVMDGVGCGEAPDAGAYGDAGSDTLGNTAHAVHGLALPAFAALGLGHLTRIEGVAPADRAIGAYGKMAEASPAKDTTTGHWEMCGVVIDEAFALHPHGFPKTLLDDFARAAGRGVMGNRHASGTEILSELGAEHLRSGDLIVYTSGDSVFQIAAHEEVVPVEELYRVCREARRLCDPYRIARIIARPFVGKPGAFRRTYNRKDFCMAPPGETLLDRLAATRIDVTGVGKISDIFGGRGITRGIHTEGNADGLRATLDLVRHHGPGLAFVNLVDFDMLFGHRNDPGGMAGALVEMDAALSPLAAQLRPGDLVAITADHGCDPTTPSTDHSREHVPLLLFGPCVRENVALPTRTTFADLGQTIAHAFGAGALANGTSFLESVLR